MLSAGEILHEYFSQLLLEGVESSFKTGYGPRCPLRSHYLVCIENHLLIVGIGPILNNELGFIYRYDRSDRTCVYTWV